MERRDGRTRGGGKGKGSGKGEWGREGKRGKWGNSALVVGGIDAPDHRGPVLRTVYCE